jgi:pimeloyl-ACP methyl ester carboxylesterase
VLLHCFFTSLTIWANNVADLSRQYRIYAPDMMGQPGKSIPDQPIRNREEMVEWLTCVIDALRLLQFDLGGYSYGGGAALDYAIHARDRVDRLILLSPVGGIVRPRTQFYVRGMLTVMPGLAAPAMRSFFNWMFYRPNREKNDVRPLADCVLRQMVLGARHFRMGTIVPPNPFPDAELRSVTAPTLLLIGQREALYDPVAATERAKRLIPKITSQLIPEAGHDLPAGQHETVNKLVLQYLKPNARA